ncbi:hypothetical protein [Celerinatantimonas sp. MCCC 1A17872]|uniref:hypothetical protein n=1 Tax=Celerinatantimonas sp. MCCC 1A17872 TaxID=3177514 RepID=UPI0038C5DB0D
MSSKIKLISCVIIASITFLYIFSMFIYPLYIGGISNLLGVLAEWQTLNAGLIALIAAAITAYIAIKIDANARERNDNQIRAENAREKERLRREEQLRQDQREREFKAAKAMLPHSLSLIASHVEDCTFLLLQAYFQLMMRNPQELNPPQKTELAEKFKLLQKPHESILFFKECIILGNENESRYLSKALTELQIFFSRMESFEKSYGMHSYWIKEMLIYSIYFYFVITGLFDYSREKGAILPPPTNKDIYYIKLSFADGEFHKSIEEHDDKDIDKFITAYINSANTWNNNLR